MRGHNADLESTTRGSYSDSFAQSCNDVFKMVYAEDYDKVGWVGITPCAFQSTMDESGSNPADPDTAKCIYKTTTSHKFLLSSTMQMSIPRLKLKDEYTQNHRIKLVEDIGYKVAVQATFGSSEVQVYWMDTCSQIILHDKMTKPGHKEFLEKHMGNTTVCKKWATCIKPRHLFYRQQWMYGFTPGKAFPMYLLTKPDDVYHEYTFRLTIADHLNMERFNIKTKEWEMIPIDMSLLDDPPKKFNKPLLFGMFANISPAEVEKRLRKKMNTFSILDIARNLELPSRGVAGETITSKYTNNDSLLQCVFWMLENTSSRHLNITHNYTLDKIPTEESDTAILSNTLGSKDGVRFSELPSPLFEGVLAPYSFNHSASRQGILSQHYVERITGGNNGGSQVLDLYISCKISSMACKGDIFELIVRTLVQKTLVIDNGRIAILQN